MNLKVGLIVLLAIAGSAMAEAEAKPEATAEAKAEAKSEAKPEANPVADPEAKAEAKPEADPAYYRPNYKNHNGHFDEPFINIDGKIYRPGNNEYSFVRHDISYGHKNRPNIGKNQKGIYVVVVPTDKDEQGKGSEEEEEEDDSLHSVEEGESKEELDYALYDQEDEPLFYGPPSIYKGSSHNKKPYHKESSYKQVNYKEKPSHKPHSYKQGTPYIPYGEKVVKPVKERRVIYREKPSYKIYKEEPKYKEEEEDEDDQPSYKATMHKEEPSYEPDIYQEEASFKRLTYSKDEPAYNPEMLYKNKASNKEGPSYRKEPTYKPSPVMYKAVQPTPSKPAHKEEPSYKESSDYDKKYGEKIHISREDGRSYSIKAPGGYVPGIYRNTESKTPVVVKMVTMNNNKNVYNKQYNSSYKRRS